MADAKDAVNHQEIMGEVESKAPPGASNVVHEQHMQITFNFWSTLGLVYSVTATPIAIGSYLTFSLVLGGSPFFVYGYIFAVGLNIVLCTALAEISSIYPHPSGETVTNLLIVYTN